ncbi:hypothetical protein HYC85_011275 [Camellia sinensis]|uniref:Uncharacterized protein n=1 Tax=Camellia sinensis TaxID=4442 RepID=A0A7J7H8L6_CAMSI|nr:hypothetical protein HYC85_011275 [Camellia sinensis]
MERMIEFPHAYMDRRPRMRPGLGWDVAPQALKVVGIKSNNKKANNLSQIVSVPNLKAKPLKKIPERSSLQQITADRYACRSAMLSSLVVAWSPVMHWMSETGSVSTDYSFDHCSILAHGAWITAIGWALFASDASDPQLLLATGSSDGRSNRGIFLKNVAKCRHHYVMDNPSSVHS